MLSGIVALTLTPALCSVLLQARRSRAEARAVRAGSTATSSGTRNRLPRRARSRCSAARGRCSRSFAVVVALVIVLVRVVPSGFLPDRRQGLLRVVDRACRPARRGSAPTRSSRRCEKYLLAQPGVAHTVALAGLEPSAGRRSADELRDGLRRDSSRGTSARRRTRAARRDSRQGERRVLADQGRDHLRLQLPGDSGTRRHRRPRDGSAGSQRERRHASSRRSRSSSSRDANKLPESQRADDEHQRQLAAALRARRPREGEGARHLAHGSVPDAAGDVVDALHQRLQPLRQDVPRAGRGAAAVPRAPRGRRPPVRAQAERAR